MTDTSQYRRGLHEVADGIHAYLQPDGTWGWSNAGLIAGAGASVLVDTLFDLQLTAAMLETMAPHTDAAPITTVVNTHANGDHCYGNQLVAGPGTAVDVISSARAAEEMDEVPPSLLSALMSADLPDPLGPYLHHAFGRFTFDGIEPPPVTRPFTGALDVEVAGRSVSLREVGPAHTGGDVIAWLPEERVLFAGDILFIGGTPIMWAGPIGNWIAACRLIEDLDPAVVVPGHGPLTDVAGVREVRAYLELVDQGTRARHAAGMGPTEAARDLDLEVNGTRFAGWTDRERLVATVHGAWRDLEPRYGGPDIVTLLTEMAEDFARRTSGA